MSPRTVSLLVALTCVAAGCPSPSNGALDASSLVDAARSPDASVIDSAAGPDLATGDITLDSSIYDAATDQSSEADSSVLPEPDAAMSDAAMSDATMSEVLDASLDDMSEPPDMSEPADTAPPAPDLTGVSASCNPTGNIVLFANFDGGVLNLDVDVDIPNLRIGVVSYDPVTINLSGAYVANVTEVRWAGYGLTPGSACASSPATTSVTGVPAGVVSINSLPASPVSNPNGYSSMVCSYSCSTTTNQGGCNTADQVVGYFTQGNVGSVRSYRTQYGCFGSYKVSDACSCIL